MRTIKYIDWDLPNATKTAMNAYAAQQKELVELCEDYWLILRVESDLFCHLPQKMFKDSPKLIK